MDSLLAPPRDTLLFLHPRFYASTAIEAPREADYSDDASKTTSAPIDYYSKHRGRDKEKSHGPTKERTSKKSDEHGDNVPTKVVPSEPRRPVDHNSSGHIAKHEPALTTIDRLRNTLRCKDASNVRQVLTAAEGRQKHKADKAFVNSRQKDKGLWSYDWRVPLRLLQQHYLPHSNDSGKEKPQLIRGVMSNQQRTEDRLRYFEIHADRIRRPCISSPLEFFNYVEDLTLSSVSRTMHHHLYRAQESHVAAIARILEELFNDHSLRDSLTVRAFDTACVFLVKYGFIPTTRVLFARMDELGLSFSAGTFNAILRGAASSKDLHNYTFFLQAMVRRGVKPSGETWIALLMAIQSKAVKLLIVETMRERGVLDQTSTFKDAVNQVVGDEFVAHLDSGQEVTAFLDFMDRSYGFDWLSVSASNRILDELGERGLLLQCVDMLGFMEQRGTKPNSVTLNTLLGHCSRQRNMDGAIQMLRVFESSFGVLPVENHFHQLFMLTWKSQLLNCCRVVWRYACMAAAVSYRTQRLVMDSLARPIPSQQMSMAEAWRCTVGKFLIGIRYGEGGLDNALRLNTIQKLVAMAEAATPSYKDPDFVKLIQQLLSDDLKAATQYRPKSGFAEKLEEALAMDRSWVRERIRKDSSTTWMIENSIDVPVALDSSWKHFPWRRN